jgi:hypothetical protein
LFYGLQTADYLIYVCLILVLIIILLSLVFNFYETYTNELIYSEVSKVVIKKSNVKSNLINNYVKVIFHFSTRKYRLVRLYDRVDNFFGFIELMKENDIVVKWLYFK